MSAVVDSPLQEVGANTEDPRFRELVDQVKAMFFGRNPDLWPVFSDPACQEVLRFRYGAHQPGTEVDKHKDGGSLLEQLKQTAAIPDGWRVPERGPDPMLLFASALSKNWEHPSCVENVITMSSDPAIFGMFMGIVANPNLVYREYAGMAADLEAAVVRQIATLAGYDPEQATGIFTQGGTFCNLYGYLLGIRKSMPDVRAFGMGASRDYRIINSQGGH